MVFGIAVLAALCAAADKGPGTYFNPKDGNAVSPVVRNEKAAVCKTVAFLGGSITEMNGFRPLVMKALCEKYPDVAFTEIAAGLSSTCSDTGAFRMRRDVLDKGLPDLLIVDSAVNDDQDGHFDRKHGIRGMEGIVRQMLLANPACKIVVALMVNVEQYDALMAGKVPLAYAMEKEVVAHYGVAIADVGSALAAAAKSGGMDWKVYRDCHPSPEGCTFGARVVMDAIDRVFDPKATPVAVRLPEPMDPLSYFHAKELDLHSVDGGSAWRVSELDWNAVPGDKRGYFTMGEVLACDRTNELATVTFCGTALGALLTAGPDAGDLEVSVDGGAFRFFRLRADYGDLHYPYMLMLCDDLPAGAHVVRLRVVAAQRKKGTGVAVRINRLYVNSKDK